MRRSGGFAGLSETITVRPGGGWTRTTKRGPDRTGKLTAAQLTKLRALIDDPRLDAEADRPRSGGTCNDTYTFVVIAGGHRIEHTECPGSTKPPAATMEIATLVLDATKA